MTELTVTERVRRWEEDRCSDCGCREDLILERVLDEQLVDAIRPDGLLCVVCLVKRATDAGLRPMAWRVLAGWQWRANL